ncbi:3-hydroxyacyl-CoA dehydrogenase family protein [Paeniglutamicibacter sp.]|uniref:3-hydroxyacyl-CoA dehydrogenase family protein n=1 Tax=Paeniglutamicibacter sp. TaxID=1934391 RepID=UPI00398A40BB
MISTENSLKIAVVGAGAMGSGIAQVAYSAGFTVTLIDPSVQALETARARISAAPVASRPTTGPGEIFTSTTFAAIAHADFIIEAVPEVLDVKLAVLHDICAVASDTAVIATNTSTIPITQLAESVNRPERFTGLHFFNPVPKMALVEIIRGEHTSEATVEAATRFVEQGLGKTALAISDRPGFVVNRLLIPYLISAATMLDADYCSAETIDSGMELGCGMPIGPIRLADYIGLDVLAHAADSIYAETNDPSCRVPENIRHLVAAGHLGRKSGQGFFIYTR